MPSRFHFSPLPAWLQRSTPVRRPTRGVSVSLTRRRLRLRRYVDHEVDPRNDGAFVNRGIAYRRIGDLDRAIHDYDEAIRLNPRAAHAFNNRGNAFRARDERDRALSDYDAAIRLDPHYAHAFNNRGIIFLELGELDRAIADFDRAISEDRPTPTRFAIAGSRGPTSAFRSRNRGLRQGFELSPSVGHGAEYAIALFGRGVTGSVRGTRLA